MLVSKSYFTLVPDLASDVLVLAKILKAEYYCSTTAECRNLRLIQGNIKKKMGG